MKEFENDIKNALNHNSAFIKCKNIDNFYVIIVNGKRITVGRNKSIWNSKKAAKTALRTHMNSLLWWGKINISKYMNEKFNYESLRKIMKDTQDEWIKEHVIYMPLVKYMNIRKRAQE